MSVPEKVKNAEPKPNTLEKIPEDCSTVEGVIAKTRCKFEKFFTIFDSRNAQHELKKEILQAPEKPKTVKMDLDELGSIQQRIGRDSMSKLLIFGADENVREKHGTFASESDREAWKSFQKNPPRTKAAKDLYETLGKKK